MADVGSGSVEKTRGQAWAERHLEPVHGLATGQRHRLAVKKEVIPIVFVPGIMGSRLETRRGKTVWDPDRPIRFMLLKYGTVFADAKSKKQAIIGDRFDPDYLRPIDEDAKHSKEYLQTFPDGQARGWTTVSWSTYGAVLKRLHEADWRAPVDDWIELPVFAFGYNWTASCLSAGEKLVERIEALIQEHREDGTRHCETVILVTHSMGGLVARAACLFLGELVFDASESATPDDRHGAPAGPPGNQEPTKVLHCIHGVQPATGAAAAYWRMKAGFERQRGLSLRAIKSYPAAWVLGTNGREVTALLANMPGGLELLPSQHYRAGHPESPHGGGSRAWLRAYGLDGSLELALPNGDRPDPYEEIYLEAEAYWRLVDPAYLDAVATDDGIPNPYRDTRDPWTTYARYVRDAKAFHADVGTGRHAATTSFAGTGIDTSVTITFRMSRLTLRSHRDMVATGQAPTDRGAFRAHVIRSDGVRAVVAMDRPSEKDGDGTVPRHSGAALSSSGSSAVEHRDVPGLEHEPAYTSGQVIAFTVETIRRVCRSRVLDAVP